MRVLSSPEQRRALLLILTLGLVWLGLDQWTKYLAVADLTTRLPEASLVERVKVFYEADHLYGYARPPAQIVPPVWEHVYVQNPAGAFGLLGGAPAPVRRAFFVTVALVASLGLLWMGVRTAGAPRARLTQVALGLVLGGALGNLADRINHGYVIDFIHWHYGRLSWPPFNVADTGIVVGVFALLLLLGKAEVPAAQDVASSRRAG